MRDTIGEKREDVIYRNRPGCSVHRPGIFGARIEDRKAKTGPASLGVGDSLLINLELGIFAVADSPDWNPAASREFLVRFDQRIEGLIRADPETWSPWYNIERIKDKLAEHTNDLIGQVDPRSSTTFTCLFVITDSVGLNGLLFHCGDSCLYRVDLGRRKISLVSRTNMDVVGRSNKISQIELIAIDEATRFLMCSDGLQALARNQNHRNLEEILLDSFNRADVDQIPDCLIDQYGRDIEFPDDVTVIALNPNKVPLGGGLSPQSGDTNSRPRSVSRTKIIL